MKRLVSVIALCVAGASPCFAGLAGDPLDFRPQVPVSAFARPSSWLDVSRLHVSTEVMVGSGFANGAQGLQVTRLSYQLGSPLAMRVSVGNAFGGPGAASSRMFLEGLDLAYRPFSSVLVSFRYQDLRSPLQLSSGNPYYSPWR